MLIRIDEASERAIYEQIADSIRADIAAGKVRAGAALPAAKRLAAALDINVHTVLRAYQQLRDERLVDLRRGRGAVVTSLAGTLVELSSEVRDLVDRASLLGVSQVTLAALVAHADPNGAPPSGRAPIPLTFSQEQTAA
ncbi:HTH-type transcriptional repressor YtrA [Leucobacter aridicollis]|uniref:GntR family transcriptional regulator n=1 Tax=Leucobacter aridicollis TaxID=283878 RepID=A0A852R9H6_9MICO|nr:GntR family transcriptional regulator [Leucobacter aridicollis]MBL3682548.1 GntR family transcriptional regulator [Leucobacter aridicollis]NYD25966.1 GntR family transcriptional regulator [Leucobacter aridicollis]RKQ89198.1 GntR family transcriptional regulator [Mycolicibacterium mucogenicum 261Sha1.1M5]